MGSREIFHKITARFRKNPFYSYYLKSTGKNLENKKWIFILGCYNSGTTLLNQILADHPAISGLPDEGVMLTNQLVKPEDFGWRRMWYKCEKEMESSVTNKKKDAITIRKHWSHFYENKEFLIEKSIANVLQIPFLEKEFQPVYFIHIVRNGYAVAEGIKRKAEILKGNPFHEKGNYPIEICAQQWVRSLQVVEEHKENLKNFIEISYELFSDNPKQISDNLTKFLGIEPYDDEYFKSSFTVHEKDSKIKNMNFKSFESLSSKEIESINEVAGEYLKKYGYELK